VGGCVTVFRSELEVCELEESNTIIACIVCKQCGSCRIEMEACPSIYLAVDVPWRDRENEAGYCPKAKGEVELTMPDTLPASLIAMLSARDIVKARGAREK
jgi:hypothetical protein